MCKIRLYLTPSSYKLIFKINVSVVLVLKWFLAEWLGYIQKNLWNFGSFVESQTCQKHKRIHIYKGISGFVMSFNMVSIIFIIIETNSFIIRSNYQI